MQGSSVRCWVHSRSIIFNVTQMNVCLNEITGESVTLKETMAINKVFGLTCTLDNRLLHSSIQSVSRVGVNLRG